MALRLFFLASCVLLASATSNREFNGKSPQQPIHANKRQLQVWQIATMVPPSALNQGQLPLGSPPGPVWIQVPSQQNRYQQTSSSSGSGYPSQQPSGGYPSQQPSGGYPSQQPSGGYPSQQPSGGYPSQQPSGGYPSQQPSGGYPSQQPSGGYPSQQPSGGYPSQQPSGGYPSQQPSGGYPPQQPSGGSTGGYPSQQPSGGSTGGYPSQQPSGGSTGGYPSQQPSGSYPPQQTTGSQNQPNYEPLRKYCKYPRGQFAHPEKCNKYYNCWDEVVIEEDCPNGLLFNEEKSYCDYPYNVNCGSREVTESPNNGTSTECPKLWGSYRSKTNCSVFYICVAGQPFKFECPSGLQYNEELGVCDYAYRVPCNSSQQNPQQEYPPQQQQQGYPQQQQQGYPQQQQQGYPQQQQQQQQQGYPQQQQQGYPQQQQGYPQPAPATSSPNEIKKVPASLINPTEVRCINNSVYRLNLSCTSVAVCRNEVPTVVHCPEGSKFDIPSQKCLARDIARC